MKFSTLAVRCSALTAVFLCSYSMAQDVDLESDQGRAGYSIGVNIGMNLVNQMPMEDINTASLVQGLSDALNGQLKLSEQEIVAAITAFSQAQQEKMNAQIAEAEIAGKTFLTENAKRPGIMTTASGLQYEVLQTGEAGAAMPEATDTVTVHYHGTLIDGTVFDSSVNRGEPASFALNQVIPGWTEGVQLMKVGDKFRFFIPPDLGYGETGAGGVIGPNSTLIFEVELLEVR